MLSARQVQCRRDNAVWVKGNQVRDLNDPVTVSGESGCKVHCAKGMRRRSRSIIRESGNLLSDPVHSFRRKQVARKNQRWLCLRMSGVCF